MQHFVDTLKMKTLTIIFSNMKLYKMLIPFRITCLTGRKYRFYKHKISPNVRKNLTFQFS